MAGGDRDIVENRRAAATIRATLSSQLITGGLAVLAVEGAFVTYTLDKREGANGFFILAASAAALIIVSVLLGSLGLDALGGNVSAGEGMSNSERTMFKWQTICLGAAIIVLPFSFLFFGTARNAGFNGDVTHLDGFTINVHSQQGKPQEFTVELRPLQE